jgi:hypothetical protein
MASVAWARVQETPRALISCIVTVRIRAGDVIRRVPVDARLDGRHYSLMIAALLHGDGRGKAGISINKYELAVLLEGSQMSIDLPVELLGVLPKRVIEVHNEK